MTTDQKIFFFARLTNRLVYRHKGLFFQVNPARSEKGILHIKMEKIALIFVFLALCVYFFSNVRATIINSA